NLLFSCRCINSQARSHAQRSYEVDELSGTLDCQQTQEMTSKSEQDRYSQRPSWPPLHMLAIIHVAVDMKRQQRTKSQRRADHSPALVVQMNYCRCREIVTLVSGIHNSFTVIGVDMIEHAVVEMTDLVDDPAGHHFGSARDIAGG